VPESALSHPQVRNLAFYGGMILAGAAAAAVARLPSLFSAPIEGRGLISLGLALALVALVVIGGLALERFDWYARMAEFLGKVVPLLLGPGVGLAGVLLLALESSLGEEALFRGFVQPWLVRLLAERAHLAAEVALPLGVGLATLLFSAVHPPLHPDLRPWTLFALVIGFAFGALAAWSGSLAAPVLAHFLINFLNLLRLSRRGSQGIRA
jgi:membrane protease YdiL (CAAX protease family)